MIFMNTGNVFFQIGALMKPYSVRHLYVNLAYMLNSLIVYILIYRSYKNIGYNVYFACILMMIRQAIRIADIEEVYLHVDES